MNCRRWRAIVLEQPVKLVFHNFLSPWQLEWLATTSVPFRNITFFCGSAYVGGPSGWDAKSVVLLDEPGCLAASRDTLQVSQRQRERASLSSHALSLWQPHQMWTIIAFPSSSGI